MTTKTDELRTSLLCKVISPAQLASEYPLTQEAADYLVQQRREVESILTGEDKRLLVIIGPCSIHDTEAALEYAGKLAALHQELKDDLCIVMRVYFEKPRTIVGWKGLISDPDLDGSFSPNKGLRLARQLLQQITELKLPIATEFLDMVNGQYIADLITWGAIGARTTESQIHREMASAYHALLVLKTVLTVILTSRLMQYVLRKCHIFFTHQTRMESWLFTVPTVTHTVISFYVVAKRQTTVQQMLKQPVFNLNKQVLTNILWSTLVTVIAKNSINYNSMLLMTLCSRSAVVIR